MVTGLPPWRKRTTAKNKKTPNYDQNDGISGVVYILTNRGLAWNYLKLGCSRHSGDKRAESLNKSASTGTPGLFKCAFEKRTVDCGLAEKRVFEKLKSYRRGKGQQEFFHLELDAARTVVIEECEKVNQEYKNREKIQQLTASGKRFMTGRYNILKELGK